MIVCEECATSSNDDDTVQKRDCSHVLCETCYDGECPLCEQDEDNRGEP